MNLSIITPDETVFEGEVKSVYCSGSTGSFTVLDGHAAMIAGLTDGPLKFEDTGGNMTVLDAESGVCEVLNNKVIVLVESVKAA
jgi:F-type H+-transporting ATPase subunit epsilon